MYLGISLELLRAVLGQCSFRQFLVPAYTSSQVLQAPSNAQSMLNTGPFQRGSLFSVYFGFLCLEVSSVSNFCPDTRGKGGLLLRLTCSVVLQGGRNTANNITVMCGECSQGIDYTGFAPVHSTWAFPVYTAQAPGCSKGKLSKVGPVLHALPRSKLLRFRFLGTPQRHRLSWACVLCHSQV